MVSETAAISSCRVLVRSSNSRSMLSHLVFKFAKNSLSAASAARVSFKSCFDVAAFSSASARSAVFVVARSEAALSSASFPDFSSPYSAVADSSSFWAVARFFSKVSFEMGQPSLTFSLRNFSLRTPKAARIHPSNPEVRSIYTR